MAAKTQGPGPDQANAPRAPRRRPGKRLAAVAALLVLLAALLGPVLLGPIAAFADPVRITLDPATRFQTFRAWETTAVFDWPLPEVPLRDAVYDHLFDVIGISRLRVEVYAGAENTRTTFADLFDKGETTDYLRLYRYQTVNDNDDPFVIEPSGFHFDDLDWRVENVWLPLKARADARGMPFEFSLNYVAFTNQSRGGPYIHDQPEEFAEFILAAFLHLKEKYGIVPDALEPILEPDNIAQWTPEKFAQATAAMTRRLKAAGFAPRVLLPSTTSAKQASVWFDAVAATPGAMDLVEELAFHMYRDASNAALKDIAARGQRYGIETAMLEYWLGKGTHQILHRCLRVANISSWQSRAYLGYSDVDMSKPPGQRLVEPEDVRFNLLYFHSIRRGAVRIGASSSEWRDFDPVAFVNPGDKWSVIVEAHKAGTIEITGLPPGDYWITTATKNGTDLPAAPLRLEAGAALPAEIGAAGVISVSRLKPGPRGGA